MKGTAANNGKGRRRKVQKSIPHFFFLSKITTTPKAKKPGEISISVTTHRWKKRRSEEKKKKIWGTSSVIQLTRELYVLEKERERENTTLPLLC